MNSAAIKHLSITKKSEFQGSLATKKEDIISMISKIKKKTTPSSAAAKNNNKSSDGTRKYVLPQFVKNTVNGTVVYKLGDIKT